MKRKIINNKAILLFLSIIMMISSPATAIPSSVSTSTLDVDGLIEESLSIQESIDKKHQELEILAENNAVIEQEIIKKESIIQNNEKKIKNLEKDVENLKEQQADIAISYYKHGNNYFPIFLEAITKADDISQAISIIDYYTRIIENNQKILEDLKQKQKELQKIKQELSITRDNLDLLKIKYAADTELLNNELGQLNIKLEENREYLVALQAQERLKQIEYLKNITADLNSYGEISLARKQVVEMSLAQLGKPYVWAAVGPDTFDCSGLIVYCYKSIGITLPHYSRSQYAMTMKITKEELKPGDLVFIGETTSPSTIGHVMMYIGGGYTIEAPRTGDVVKIRPLSARSESTIVGYTTVFINEEQYSQDTTYTIDFNNIIEEYISN